jgi:predicted nuclease of predicted toxin-antitoxin system
LKLLIDMNLSPRWVAMLSVAGIEALHRSTLGNPLAFDEEIMAFARQHDYVVHSHDLDFGAVLAVTQGLKPSVVQIRADGVSPEAIGPQVITALRQMAKELDSGALLTIEPARI